MREASAGTPDESPTELDALRSPRDAFKVALPNFEGPLDLLLHLIKEHKLDIFDIPIALVTEKYVEHLTRMKEVNLDIAGEFLVMAATLAHIKSRLLLPRQELPPEVAEIEEQGDPRAELVRRLLEYQKYKEAGETLARQDILDRDVFTRKVAVDAVPIPDDEIGLAEISVYKLIEALDRVLKTAVPEKQHEVVRESYSITGAIKKIAERLARDPEVRFTSLFTGMKTRSEIIANFLAILEMCRMKVIRVYQRDLEADGDDDIVISAKGDGIAALADPTAQVKDDYK